MTNYYITRMNTLSGMHPDAPEPEVRGTCQNPECGEDLREDYTYFKDNEGNTFCCTDCLLKFHGAEECDWD